MTWECNKCKRTSEVVRLDQGCPFCNPEKQEAKKVGASAIIRLLLLLPFYIPATILAFVAGMIGGREWRVGMRLEQHQKGQKMASVKIDIME